MLSKIPICRKSKPNNSVFENFPKPSYDQTGSVIVWFSLLVPISAGYIVRHRWWVGLMVAFDILAVVFQWVMHVVSVSDKDDKTLMSKTYFQLK